MKRRWKGALVGGIVGGLFGLLLFKIPNVFGLFGFLGLPLKLILKILCLSSSSCSDILGFVVFSILFNSIFYCLVGVLIGFLICRWTRRGVSDK